MCAAKGIDNFIKRFMNKIANFVQKIAVQFKQSKKKKKRKTEEFCKKEKKTCPIGQGKKT